MLEHLNIEEDEYFSEKFPTVEEIWLAIDPVIWSNIDIWIHNKEENLWKI